MLPLPHARFDGPMHFICVFRGKATYRFNYIRARDFSSARSRLLSAELDPGEKPLGIMHANVFYPWLGDNKRLKEIISDQELTRRIYEYQYLP